MMALEKNIGWEKKTLKFAPFRKSCSLQRVPKIVIVKEDVPNQLQWVSSCAWKTRTNTYTPLAPALAQQHHSKQRFHKKKKKNWTIIGKRKISRYGWKSQVRSVRSTVGTVEATGGGPPEDGQTDGRTDRRRGGGGQALLRLWQVGSWTDGRTDRWDGVQPS